LFFEEYAKVHEKMSEVGCKWMEFDSRRSEDINSTPYSSSHGISIDQVVKMDENGT